MGFRAGQPFACMSCLPHSPHPGALQLRADHPQFQKPGVPIPVSVPCVSDTRALLTPQGSSGDERAMAKELAELLCDGDADTVAEGQEPPEFWDLLGGKAPYANDKR